MIEMFCRFLPVAVCMVALPTLLLKRHKLRTDGLLCVICLLMMVYFASSLCTSIVWVIWMGKTLGILILPLIYFWARSASHDSRTAWIQILKSRYEDRDWSARDQYMVRADIAMLLGVVTDLARLAVPSLSPDSIWLSVLSVLQAVALYVFFASAIYLGILDNPAINRETYRAVQQARRSELRDSFEKLMAEQRPYLQQGVTIEDVALMLATNRTYVSQMLRDDYGCSFPDYITEKRLEASKQYMQEHPEANQEEVAFACGFANAPIFNKRFRQAYGRTPGEWKKLRVVES